MERHEVTRMEWRPDWSQLEDVRRSPAGEFVGAGAMGHLVLHVLSDAVGAYEGVDHADLLRVCVLAGVPRELICAVTDWVCREG